MSSAKELHDRAMDLVENAILERMRGDTESMSDLYAQALELELKAIGELERLGQIEEPTWSVLHRGAGWMAFNSKQYRTAERLASKALAGDPHPEIAEELRDLWEQSNYHMRLEPTGITMSEEELLLSLAGRMVGSGVTLLSEVVSRVTNFQRLAYRIAQRKLDLPYKAQIPSDIRKNYPTFVAAPKAGSFVISLRLGHPTPQSYLPEFLSADEVIEEFLDLMEFANNSQVSEIQERIPDPEYQRNFFGLAKNMAPDGNKIRRVGFTMIRRRNTRHLSVTTPSSRFPRPYDEVDRQQAQTINVSGILRYADASAGDSSNNRIRLINNNGPQYIISVPPGMMDDIVRPLWNSFVTVAGTRRRRQQIIQLHDIWESSPDSENNDLRANMAVNLDNGVQTTML